MISIRPQDVKTSELHAYMLGAVAPRPIAFASTISSQGEVNLSPFSFFNAFGSNPPILIFSPARRVRDNTIKHSLENVREVPEVVINIINYPMVEQASLASTEYERGINEFIKAGFTQVPSELIKPPRVGESPVSFECKVNQVIETGQQGGAGNLIICEILMVHIKEEILDENRKIDPNKIDLVARMGGDWYCRASGAAIFEIPKPLTTKGIGVDHLPEHVKHSPILTGNNLGRLANVEQIPTQQEVQDFRNHEDIQNILKNHGQSSDELMHQLHRQAQHLLEAGKIKEAWLTLMQYTLPL